MVFLILKMCEYTYLEFFRAAKCYFKKDSQAAYIFHVPHITFTTKEESKHIWRISFAVYSIPPTVSNGNSIGGSVADLLL